MALSEEQQRAIQVATTGQRTNPNWHLFRKGRVTASNFGAVLRSKRVTASLIARVLGQQQALDGVLSVQWGTMNECEGVRAFTTATQMQVHESGWWLSQSGLLGASPDGLVGSSAVLETKRKRTSCSSFTKLQGASSWHPDEGGFVSRGLDQASFDNAIHHIRGTHATWPSKTFTGGAGTAPPPGPVFLLRASWTPDGRLLTKRRGSPGKRRALVSRLTSDYSPRTLTPIQVKLGEVEGLSVGRVTSGSEVETKEVTHDHASDLPDLPNVPSCYHNLREVFSKTRASTLPPHRPYDCAIDLLPGAPIPKGRLYSISGPERQSMTDYIDSSLKAGLIRPSSSPAGAGFFFVGKKDGSLRPCIDYSPLNDITVKNRVPCSACPPGPPRPSGKPTIREGGEM
ncbi:uncharacterized protein LOC117549482 [Gymnodraco acuticeps]|uniref:Uncharacterized protein LOC117549482 n=1 Tax=Gymnodraco acuticeps TaxID=8218 RepID=A0A6P8VLK8_GYMAC|nr:uncharacterized protein LOC117549482 [Gymnodraco acuticeps]